MDTSSHKTFLANNYYKNVGAVPFYESFYKKLQEVATHNDVDFYDFGNSLIDNIKLVGIETQLRNDLFYWVKERSFIEHGLNCWVEKECMDYLRQAQMHWEKRIYKSLNSMCTELGVSLSVFRSVSDRDEMMEKWNLLSTHAIDMKQYRPVYAPRDFLDVLLDIKNPNYVISTNVKRNGVESDFSSLLFKVHSLTELKNIYIELTKKEQLIGTISTSTPLYFHFEEKRICWGKNILQLNQASVTQEYLKCLAPHSLRGKLWAQVLGSEILPWHREYFDGLEQLVGRYDMLVDKLIFKDIQLTVCNDDQYFVFEDLLYKILLCFSRDTAVASVLRCNNSHPIIGTLKGKTNLIQDTVTYPPSGVIPFHGFSMYAAPLCYVFNDPVQLYFSMRSLYLRFWNRLQEINSHKQGILSLCILFQQLLEYNEPFLCSHFRSINVQPIKVVFKWLIRCFSGYLPSEQLLYLWDLILGYDSLEILSLLAMAILSLRRNNLLKVQTMNNVEVILADLSSVQIISLLQIVLESN